MTLDKENEVAVEAVKLVTLLLQYVWDKEYFYHIGDAFPFLVNFDKH